MTEQTKDVIKKFAVTLDVSLIPNIILCMQVEDNVSNVIQFKNCFRQLRNIAAHEPAVILTQLFNEENKMSSRLVFDPASNKVEDRVVVSVVQFTAWMFDMSLRTDNKYYIIFWRAFMKAVYPDCVEPSRREFKFYRQGEISQSNLVKIFLDYQKYMAATRGMQKVVAPRDPYMCDMLNTNSKVFWRMAIPDMMPICNLFASGDVDLSNDKNIKYFLYLFKEREGV